MASAPSEGERRAAVIIIPTRPAAVQLPPTQSPADVRCDSAASRGILLVYNSSTRAIIKATLRQIIKTDYDSVFFIQ